MNDFAASRLTHRAGWRTYVSGEKSYDAVGSQAVFWLGIGCFLMASASEFLFAEYSERFAPWPFVLGLATIGMAHGAADFWKLTLGGNRYGIGIRLGVYLALVVAALMLLLLQSSIGLQLFVLLAAFHFGHEDVTFGLTVRRKGHEHNVASRISRFSAEIGSYHPSASLSSGDGLLAWGRGSVVIGVPLVLHPAESADFFRRIQRVIGTTPTEFAWEHPLGWNAIALAIGSLMIAAAWRCSRSRQSLWHWLTESGTLVFSAVVLNPEFFIGLYLLIWHAPRHLSQIATISGRSTFIRVFSRTVVFLIPAWIAVGFIWLWNLHPTGSLGDENTDVFSQRSIAMLSAITVASYAVVTLPHHLLETATLSRRSNLLAGHNWSDRS